LHSGQVFWYARHHPVPTITAYAAFTRKIDAFLRICLIFAQTNGNMHGKEQTLK